jgi:hypothetical protein
VARKVSPVPEYPDANKVKRACTFRREGVYAANERQSHSALWHPSNRLLIPGRFDREGLGALLRLKKRAPCFLEITCEWHPSIFETPPLDRGTA